MARPTTLTEWAEFRELDWNVMGALTRTRAVVDTRNILDHAAIAAEGFRIAANGIDMHGDRHA